jgi:hypothetical protein
LPTIKGKRLPRGSPGHQSGGARFPSPREGPHDLWMAFFNDPDGHTLALMHEAPKGYALPH